VGGAFSTYGESKGLYRILVGKPEVKRPRRTWDDNSKMALQKVECGGMDWIDMAQDKDR